MKYGISKISFTATLAAAQLLLTIPCYAVDSAPLHPITLQNYRMTLSGNVQSLGKAFAGADVSITVQPLNGKLLEAKAVSGKDGQFNLEVSFKASPSEYVDWRLVAQSGRFSSLSEEGRRILSAEPAIEIQKHISLTEELVML